MRYKNVFSYTSCVLAMLLSGCLALTVATELITVRADDTGNHSGRNVTPKDAEQYLVVVDRIAKKHGFVQFSPYDRSASTSSIPKASAGSKSFASYRGSTGVYLHVVIYKATTFPSVSVVGNDTNFPLVADTADEILHALQQQFPQTKFSLKRTKTYGEF